MNDFTAERVAQNDATFRDANEQISRQADAYGIEGFIPFICECAEESCTEIVRLDLEEYERIRADSTHFLNVPGHHVAAQGHAQVIEEHERYAVVQKIGRAGEIVRELDDRSPR